MGKNIKGRAMAIVAHPDDIEFSMAGTMLLLKKAGFEIHYMNIGNGSCGTCEYDAPTIIKMRREEAMAAAKLVGAVYHESLVNDIEIFYEIGLLRKLTSVVRSVSPDIVLTHYPFDYMEDHSNTCRLAVSAVFCRGMQNFTTEPDTPPKMNDTVIYHAMPVGHVDPLRRKVSPDIFIGVDEMMDKKAAMLSCHKSQKEWLDKSQGMDSYVDSMIQRTAEVGKMSRKFKFAEAWFRHLHVGFCAPD
ncbi:MAG: PIG-L family deacetylase, partial [Lentisphaerae bacterium]|nr:PIG-L family deacetylase [Lentisphaerota bacterium]